MNTILLVLNYCTTLWNNSNELLFEIVDYQIRDVEIKFKYDLLEMLRLHFRYVTLDEKTTSLFNCPPVDCSSPSTSTFTYLQPCGVDPSTRRPIPVNARLSFLRSHHGRKGTAEQKLDVWILLFCSERSVNTNGCVPSRIASFRVDFAATGREIASRDPPHRSFV